MRRERSILNAWDRVGDSVACFCLLVIFSIRRSSLLKYRSAQSSHCECLGKSKELRCARQRREKAVLPSDRSDGFEGSFVCFLQESEEAREKAGKGACDAKEAEEENFNASLLLE